MQDVVRDMCVTGFLDAGASLRLPSEDLDRVCLLQSGSVSW